MKFILNENKKFLLSESANLIEELLLESEAAISVSLQGLFTTTSKLKADISTDFNLSAIDGTPLEDKKEAIEKELTELRLDILDLLFGRKNFKNLLTPIYDRARDKALVQRYNYSNAEIGVITDLCKILSSAIDTAKTNISHLRQNKIRYFEEKPKEFSNWFENFKNNLIKIKTTLEKLYQATDNDEEEDTQAPRIDLAVAFEELFKLSERKESFFSNESWDYSAIPEDISKRTAELNNFIVKIKAAESIKAPTVALLWEAYYTWLWSGVEKEVKALGEAFIDQLFTKGFSEVTNEFINYLKYILKTKQYTITGQAYNAIHNLILDRKLDKEHIHTSNENKSPEKLSLALCPVVLKQTSGKLVYDIIEAGLEVLKTFQTEFTYSNPQKEKRTIKMSTQAKISLLSLIFNENNANMIKSSQEATINQIGMLIDPESKHYNKALSDSNSTACILNTGAALRDLSKVNIILQNLNMTHVIDKQQKSKVKTTTSVNPDEFWKSIQKYLGTSKKDIELFFSFLLMVKANSAETYSSLATIINKKLFGIENGDLSADESTWKSELATYNKIISDLDITSDNITSIINKLFQKIPEDIT
jgi:hypothetical protein